MLADGLHSNHWPKRIDHPLYNVASDMNSHGFMVGRVSIVAWRDCWRRSNGGDEREAAVHRYWRRRCPGARPVEGRQVNGGTERR